jgi:thiol-disulfide isomerase/thioredoxin
MTLVPDDQIKINADFATYELKPNLSGSKWASTMNDYMAVFSKFHVGQQELMNKRDSIPAEELTDLFTKLKTPIDSFSLVRMDKDPSNPFNIVLQGAAVPSMGFNDWDEKNLEVLKKVASAFEEKYPGSPVTTTMTNQVYQIEMEYNQHIANSSGTRVAPEIALKNPDGVEMKLSTLRGQYVLIDFWASWCMPCRRENPNVVRLYNKYKNKGFTIFSVSLDKDAEAWKEAIEKDGLVWPNHVSDLLQWNSPLPQLYGFSGIPHTVLVNPQGNIIGVGLRGASLEQKLEEIFAK